MVSNQTDSIGFNSFQNAVQVKIKSVKEEIAAVSRKVYLTQDKVSTKKARCEELDRGIFANVLTCSTPKLVSSKFRHFRG